MHIRIARIVPATILATAIGLAPLVADDISTKSKSKQPRKISIRKWYADIQRLAAMYRPSAVIAGQSRADQFIWH